MTLHHATCVEYKGKGIIISGASGMGKSDLALRLIEAGGILVSDDYVEVGKEGNILVAHGPKTIRGMIEVRGVGLMKVDYLNSCSLCLSLSMTPQGGIERLPEKHFFEQDGIKIPHYKFDGFSVSAIAKINLILASI